MYIIKIIFQININNFANYCVMKFIEVKYNDLKLGAKYIIMNQNKFKIKNVIELKKP